MAAGLAAPILAERLSCRTADLRARGVVVQSAGTSGGRGGASTHALEVMAKRGIDLSDHFSAALSEEMVQQADYIFAMTQVHRETILRLSPSAEPKVRLLLDGEDVRDPMGSEVEEYERCAQTIERGLRDRLQEVIV